MHNRLTLVGFPRRNTDTHCTANDMPEYEKDGATHRVSELQAHTTRSWMKPNAANPVTLTRSPRSHPVTLWALRTH